MERRTPFTHTFKMMYRTNVPFNVTPVSQATPSPSPPPPLFGGECETSCEVKKSMKYLRARMKAKRMKRYRKTLYTFFMLYLRCLFAYSQFHRPVECGERTHNTQYTIHNTLGYDVWLNIARPFGILCHLFSLKNGRHKTFYVCVCANETPPSR